jgi:CRP-like cAMP-binding protein
MRDGSTVEIGVVGPEGMVGIHALLGIESTPNESMVQVPGDGMRIRIGTLLDEFRRGGALQDLTLRYLYAFMMQISQTAACNRLHTVEERLARWLLMCHDRVEGDELALTHDFLAMMLGVRRAGVTGAAVALQAEGYIRYSRGHVTVMDRKALEEFVCECYAAVKAEFDRALMH